MTKDLTQGSPAKLILGFAFPLLAGMLFQQFYSLVDTLIVGQFLGVNALAGVGSTGSVSFLVLGFGMGICSGFTTGSRWNTLLRTCIATRLPRKNTSTVLGVSRRLTFSPMR